MAEQKVRGSDQIMPGTVTDVEVDDTVIVADGSHPFSGNQPMGGNRVTGAGDPVDPQDYVTRAFMESEIAAALATAGGEPLTNGNPLAPELIFNAFGDVIMVRR